MTYSINHNGISIEQYYIIVVNVGYLSNGLCTNLCWFIISSQGCLTTLDSHIRTNLEIYFRCSKNLTWANGRMEWRIKRVNINPKCHSSWLDDDVYSTYTWSITMLHASGVTQLSCPQDAKLIVGFSYVGISIRMCSWSHKKTPNTSGSERNAAWESDRMIYYFEPFIRCTPYHTAHTHTHTT